MGGLLMRRQLMVPTSAPTPEWDYEWEFADGLPQNNGLTRSTSGTFSETMRSDGLLLTVANSSSVWYQYPSTISGTGRLYARFWMSNTSNTTTGARAWFRLGNSSSSLILYFGYYSGRKIKLGTTSGQAGGQDLGEYKYSAMYDVDISINNGYGHVVIKEYESSWTTIIDQDNIDLTTTYYNGGTRFGAQNAGNTGVIWKFFKLKKGRL